MVNTIALVYKIENVDGSGLERCDGAGSVESCCGVAVKDGSGGRVREKTGNVGIRYGKSLQLRDVVECKNMTRQAEAWWRSCGMARRDRTRSDADSLGDAVTED